MDEAFQTEWKDSWMVTELCDLSKWMEHWLCGIAMDNQGIIYFTAGESGLWKLDRNYFPSDPKQLIAPKDDEDFKGIVFDGHNKLYVCNASRHTVIQYDIKTGNISNLVGTGRKGNQDGEFFNATFAYPWGICMDNNSNIYVTDCHHIRKISLKEGTVQTIAGSTMDGYGGFKDGDALSCRFASPSGIVVGEEDAVYVCDGRNHCVRKVKDGQVVTISGSPQEKGTKDGRMREAQFKYPRGLIMDEDGNLLITDSFSLRKLDFAKKIVSTPPGWTALELASTGEICGIPFHKDGNIFIGTLGLESFNLLVIQSRWKIVRLLWIAFLKEDKEHCLLTCLPKDLIKEIDSFLQTSKKHTPRIEDLKS